MPRSSSVLARARVSIGRETKEKAEIILFGPEEGPRLSVPASIIKGLEYVLETPSILGQPTPDRYGNRIYNLPPLTIEPECLLSNFLFWREKFACITLVSLGGT